MWWWLSDDEDAEAVTAAPKAAAVAPAQRPPLVPGGDARRGAPRVGLVLVTADYGYAVPEQESARREVARASRELPAGWVHEVKIDSASSEEAARYGPPEAFPAVFVSAPPETLLVYYGPMRAASLVAAARAVLPAPAAAPPREGRLHVLGAVKSRR